MSLILNIKASVEAIEKHAANFKKAEALGDWPACSTALRALEDESINAENTSRLLNAQTLNLTNEG